jgi:endonuclease-3
MSTANEIYQIISEMYPEARCELDYQNLYQLLIAVALSAQTTDAAVNKVTPALFARYPSFFELAQADPQDVRDMIRIIGLATTKAKNLVALSKKMISEKQGAVVSDFAYLITLPGIGRKCANVILSEGFRIPRIAVDTHVQRVAKRLGFSESDNPKDTEEILMQLFPQDAWYDVHLKLLFFGRYFCTAKKPKCPSCPVQQSCHFFTKKTP